jgi:hypothetical protein
MQASQRCASIWLESQRLGTLPLPAELSDRELEQRLLVNGGVQAGARHHVEPEWAAVTGKLKRGAVNLKILWEDCRAVHSDGYAYSSYVVAELMLRLVARARDTVGNPWLDPQHRNCLQSLQERHR